MGFMHQLIILLWKNWTLKRRSPFVLLLEILIPLTLFFILVSLRHHKPSVAKKQNYYMAQPLPSAGVIPVMQVFCPTAVRDPFGLPDHPNAEVTMFLNQLDQLLNTNTIFTRKFSLKDISLLPDVFQDILEYQDSVEYKFASAEDFPLSSVLKDDEGFRNFLVHNLSLSQGDANQIMDRNISTNQLFKVLYGSPPRNSSNPYSPDNATDFGDYLDRRFGNVKSGALFRAADPSDLYSMEGLVDILSQAPGVSDSPDGVDESRGNMSASMQLAQYFEDQLFDPDELQDLTCNNDLGTSLYDNGPSDQQRNASSSGFRERVCNHEESYPLFVSLSQELHDQIDLDKLIDKLNLTDNDLINSRIKAVLASKEVQKFARFQQTLQDVYMFAQKLPGDSCPAPTTPPPPTEFPFTSEGPTQTPILTPQSPSSTPPAPIEDHTLAQDLGTEVPFTTFPDEFISNFTTNLTTNWNDTWANLTASPSAEATPTPASTTPTPKAKKKPSPSPTPKTKQQEQKDKVALLYRLWAKIQYSVCGVELKVNQGLLDKGDVRGLKLTHDQKKSLSLLLHVLFSRPTILYSPNTPDVNDVIDKASDFIYLAKNISHSAEMWLNISKTIREYLDMNTTQLALEYLGKMEEQLSEHPEFLSNSTLSPDLQVFITNSSLVSVPYIRNHLDVIDNAACAWLELTRPIKWDLFVGFPDEESMVQYALGDSHADGRTVFASVAFETNKDGTLPSHTVYKIRQNSSFTDRTDLVRRRFWRPGANHHAVLGYYTYGFVWVQDIIDRAIIDKQVGRTVIEPGSYAQEFPYPCYVSDMFPFTIEQVMPMVMVISWVYSVAMLTQSIVYEKELRLKEVMKMMGLSNAVHWVAWFITSFLQLSVTTGVLTAMLIAGKVLANSNPVIVWLFLTVYSVSVISFSFLVSSLFSKAKIAAACAGIIYFTSFVPCIYIQIREETWAYTTISSLIKCVASLSCTTAFGLGARYFALYEIGGVGVQWHTLNLSPVEHDDYNLQKIFMMLGIDIVLYLLLTWYIEGVHPGAYGLPRRWYFPVQPSYWFGSHRFKGSIMSKNFWKPKRYNHLSVMEDDQAMAMSNSDDDPCFEPEPVDLELGVSIENLTKIYSAGKKLAVNNLCLNLYEGQITSFLGHNGAGKTTTMSVLTGLFPPTSGTAKIYGQDIRTDMTAIRKSLGMCPQHNALFDKLTVEDHVWFYAQLKGKPKWQIKAETDKLISDIGLTHKRKTAVHRLSGGMKRRLSVAIAFVGNSRTVILDEPTAGVDPCARRAIWDLLLKYKHGRTILLSTHHMDEADFLGDRIAVISHGQVKCTGSSLYLKTTYGDGYHLTVVKKPVGPQRQSSIESDDGLGTSFRTLCTESNVTKFVQDLVPGACLTNQNLRELSYTLPFDSVAFGHFPKLFTALDQKKEKLYISSYGLRDTTLEEVFLKVAEDTGANRQDVPSRSSTSSGFGSLSESHETQCSSGSNTFRNQSSSVSSSSSSSSSSGRFSSPSTGEMENNETETGETEGAGGGGGTFTKLWRRRRGRNGGRSSGAGDVPLIAVNEETSNHGNTTTQDDAAQLGNSINFTKQTGILHQLVVFIALLKKRLHHVKRNRKGLFSQLLLPAFFVTIAMTVALSAPHIGDLPPLSLSPSQYHPFEYPEGNFIPYTDEALNDRRSYRIYHSKCGDAGPQQLTETFKFPAGIGASCILKTPFNGTLDQLVESANYTHSVGLTGQYYDHMCEESFTKGRPLSNYVPTPPSSNPHEEEEIDEAHGGTHIKEVKCSCSEDRKNFQCPKNVGTPDPPVLEVITSDQLLDVSGRNLSEYLLYTTNKFRLHRYGALSFGNVRNFVPPKYNDDVPTTYKKIAVRNAAMTWYNHKGFHSPPTYLSVMNNAILRANLDPSIHGNPSAYGISVINQPMNKTSSTMLDDYTLQETSQVLIAMFIIVAMSFVPASFVVFVVAERASKAKHLQFVSGVNPLVYWLSNFFWDMMNYLVPATCCVTILKAFNIPAYSSSTNLPAVIILFLLYGFSITPMMYPASFIFNESSLAYVCLIVVNLFIGITTICGSFLVELFNLDDEMLKKVYDTMYSVYLIFPNYCLGRGLMDLAYNDYMNEYYTKIGAVDEVKSPFRWDMLNRMFFVMVLEGVLAFAFTVLCEYGYVIRTIEILPCFRRKKVDKSLLFCEDEDVLRERQRVLVGEASQDLLRIENLTKIYKTRRLGRHLAVDGLCLGVPEGECFGLLGVNGAGKTTTFKMLCGDLGITGGDAYINRDSIFKKKMKAYKSIGYCPQFDALFDELTAREHLLFYARIKGVQQKDEKQVVTWALRKMALMQYADRPVGTYSGGNKRKLSTAIALLGNPQIIFMDEPTTGMDPHSRRFLWDCLLSIVREGQRSVILTSHSMEECEVLCGRLAIMVNGKFKCLGSAQHLKNRYGDGYKVTLKVDGERPNLKPVTRWFSHTFPHSELKEEHFNMVQYSVKLEHLDLAAIFTQIEDMRTLLNIKDYSVSQTTLDDVFVTFAKQQVGHEDDDTSGSKEKKKSSKRTKLEMKSLLLDESHLESDSDDEFLLKFSKNNPHLTFDIEV